MLIPNYVKSHVKNLIKSCVNRFLHRAMQTTLQVLGNFFGAGELGESSKKIVVQTPLGRFAGFSLVELHISLALGLLIIAALGQVFSGAIRSHGRILATSNLQESMLLIDAFLSRAAVRAGYFGCLGDRRNIAKFLRGSWQELPEYDLRRPVEGYENSGNGSFQPSIQGLPLSSNRRRLHKPNNGIRASILGPRADVLVLRGMGDIAGDVIQQGADSSLLIEVGSHHLEPENDDILVLADCNQAAIFNTTNLRRSGSMLSLGWTEGSGMFANMSSGITATGSETAIGLSLVPEGFSSSSVLTHVSTTIFFIGRSQGADTRGNDLYSLWQKEGSSRPIELVRGVKDMQILYGVKSGLMVDEQNAPVQMFLEGGIVGYYQWDRIPNDAVVASIWITFVLESVYGLIDEEHYAPATSFSLTYALENMRPRVLGVSP
jgi:type IV pilus assembly protein PilW|tara:strand:+ start:105 stop:1403 length:1299 start_codon:yes stop_codon:yes gene_type:complete